MAINTLSFTTLVRQQVAAIQAACSSVLTFVVGSLELARVQAIAGVSMWLQSLVMQLLTTTRLSTSSGSDVDSFVGDFGLTREAAVQASGTVIFSRFTPTNAATIAVGSTVATSDGTQSFVVIADSTQPLFNATLNAYVIPATVTSGNVTVQAANAGSQGNVLANTVTVISSAIVGVDTVANPNAFINGVDQESDTALRARFLLYIQGLRQGIKSAVGSAIANLQQGIQYDLVENLSYGGASQSRHSVGNRGSVRCHRCDSSFGCELRRLRCDITDGEYRDARHGRARLYQCTSRLGDHDGDPAIHCIAAFGTIAVLVATVCDCVWRAGCR